MSRTSAAVEASLPPAKARRGRANVPVDIVMGDMGILARGAGISLLGRGGGRAIVLATHVLLARFLGPRDFGLYALGWTVFRFASQVAPLGLDNGVIRILAIGRNDPGRIKGALHYSLGFAALFGVASSAALVGLAPWLASTVFKDPKLTQVLWLMAPAVALFPVLRVSAAATRATERATYSVLSEDITQPLSGVVLIVIFNALGWRLYGAIAAIVVSFALAALLALTFASRLFGSSLRRRVVREGGGRDLLAFSLPTAFAGIFVAYIMWSDRLIIGFFMPTATVGVYSALSQLALLLAILLGGFGAIVQPMIGHRAEAGDIGRVENLYRVSTRWSLYLALPLGLVIMLEPAVILEIAFGQAYRSGAAALVILIAGQLVNAGTGVVGILLVMTGHHRRWMRASVVAFVSNLVLTGVLVSTWGMVGAAIGSSVSVAALFTAGVWAAYRHVGVWPYDRTTLKVLAAGLLSGGVGALLRVTVQPGISRLGVVALGVVASFIGLIAMAGLDEQDARLLSQIRKRVLG